MDLIPTDEQLAIKAGAGQGESMLVQAGAGAAKTTTLKLLAQDLLGKKVLAVAFNRRIADDLQKALPETVTVKTLNGLGHGARMKQRNMKLEVDSSKLARLTSSVMKDNGP